MICLNLVFAINCRWKSSILVASNTPALQIELGVENQGNITRDENQYFIRYVISCNKEVKNIQWNDNKDYIDIHIDKNEISKFKLNRNKKLPIEEINYSNTEEGFILRIKKSLDKNNFVTVDNFNEKNIYILISKEDNPYKHSIVLDPGHGGIDKGASLGSLYEKNINFKIANYAAKELEFNGIKVYLTREEDKLLSLREIGDITNSTSADIFVSVHVNENKESKYKGVTSYYYDPDGFQKKERIKLAQTMQDELTKSDGWFDRGIIRENFAVLRLSNMPSVLLECGFLSNPEDRGKLTEDSVLRNFANNITNGVINYFVAEQTNN
jgi:N-acetylmuramoyl-L-alanine amidase